MADLQHIANMLQESADPADHLAKGLDSSQRRSGKRLWGGPRTESSHRRRKREYGTAAHKTDSPPPDSQCAAQPAQSDLTSTWNQPCLTVATSRAWHCEVCQAAVPMERQRAADEWASSGSWRTHIAGITHRRAALARQHGLKEQDSIVSTFESLDVTALPQKAASPTRREDKQLVALHSEIVKELLDCAGSAAINGPSGRALSPAMLATARHDMDWQWDRLRSAVPQQYHLQKEAYLKQHPVRGWTLQDLLPAEVAALADMLPSIWLRELKFSAHMGGRQGLPAAVVALCMLASRIGRTCSVRHLCLELVCTDGERHDHARSLMLRLIRALTHMVECAGSLRLVEIHLIDATWKSLHVEREDLGQLIQTARACPTRRRCAVLSALCARDCGHSIVPAVLQSPRPAPTLPQLPPDILLEILNWAAPLHKCKVTLKSKVRKAPAHSLERQQTA